MTHRFLNNNNLHMLNNCHPGSVQLSSASVVKYSVQGMYSVQQSNTITKNRSLDSILRTLSSVCTEYWKTGLAPIRKNPDLRGGPQKIPSNTLSYLGNGRPSA